MRVCAVFGCKTNCKVKQGNRWVNPPYKACFKFPFIPSQPGNVISLLEYDHTDSTEKINAKKLTKLWVNALPNSKSSLVINDSNGICIDHFKQEDYKTYKDGRKKLNDNAVPTIFEMKNQESIQIKLPPKRISLSEKEDEIIAKVCKISADSYKNQCEKSEIDSFEKLKEKIKLITDPDLTITIKPEFVHICIIDFETSSIHAFLKISTDLSYSTSISQGLPSQKITNEIILMEIIEKLKTDNSSQFCKSKIQMLLDKLDNVDETMKSLISDQIQNLDISPHARRFSPSAMLIYMKIFLYSQKFIDI